MNKIEKFLNSEETFFKVLDILNQHGNMSTIKQDFVAGGSVSNAIYHLLHNHKLVINDIDVYKEVKSGLFGEEKFEVWYHKTYTNEDSLEVVDDQYGRTFISDSGARVRVVKSGRSGIFNNIDYVYEKGYMTSNKTKEFIILEGFDLNCCKAGLDLVNSKIIYTPEFVDFLSTKQIKVVNPCAPVQSTIRICKKLQDLENSYCNVEHEVRFLTVASKHIFGNQITKVIGPETKAKYDKVKDFVEKYFILRKPKNPSELPYDLRDKFFINNKPIPDVEIWTYDPVIDFDILDIINNINFLKRIWYLMYTVKRKSEQDKINKIFYKNLFLGNMSEDIWERNVYHEDGYVAEKCYSSNRFTYNMILTKKDYYKCDFSIAHVDFIDKMTHEHFGLKGLIKNLDTLTEQYRLLKFIKSLAKKEGEWIIGSLENVNWEKIHKENILPIKELILKIVEKDKVESSVDLTKRLDLSEFEYKNFVKELATTIELRTEGKKMGHCVGGYSNSIKSGDSRIFHIDYNGIGSTVELATPKKKFWYRENGKYETKNGVEFYQPKSWSEDLKSKKCIVIFEDGKTDTINISEIKYSIRQHNGRYPEKGNLEPTNSNKEIVNKLLEFLNQNILETNFANKENERIFV